MNDQEQQRRWEEIRDRDRALRAGRQPQVTQVVKPKKGVVEAISDFCQAVWLWLFSVLFVVVFVVVFVGILVALIAGALR